MTPIQALREIVKTGDAHSVTIAKEALNFERMSTFADRWHSRVEHEGTVHIGEYVFGFDDGFCYTIGTTDGGKLLEGDCTTDEMYEAASVAMYLHSLGYRVDSTGGGCTAWRLNLNIGYVLLTYPGDPSAPMNITSPVLVGIYDCDDRLVLNFEITNIRSLPALHDGQKI